MMGLPLYGSLLAGWMAVSVMALLATGAPVALRVLLAALLLVLCGGAGWAGPGIARAFMGTGPALALCVHVAMGARSGEGRGGTVPGFLLAGNAALAVAFGRCDLLFMFMGAGMAVRLALAQGPRGLDRAGWQVLRAGLGGLMMAQGGLSVLQAQWGGMADQAGAVLLVGGVLLACGMLADAAADHVPPCGRMDMLAALPVMARAADTWPVIRPVLTFMGLVCLLWSVLPRGARRPSGTAWGAWAVLAAGLPGADTTLALPACLLAVAITEPDRTGRVDETGPSWPPFLPGMALVLVLVGQVAQQVWAALLAAVTLWPVMARYRMGQAPGMRGVLSLVLGCMVLAAVIRHGGGGP